MRGGALVRRQRKVGGESGRQAGRRDYYCERNSATHRRRNSGKPLRVRSDCRGHRRRLGCARHVRAAGVANLDHRALGVGSVARGSRCHRSVCSSRFLAASPARLPPFPAPWALHHLGVLVHGLDVICKSRSDDCAFALGHLCGHRACRDCPIHVGPVCRNALRDRACALALGNRCVHTSQTKITPAIVRFRFI